jgi:hypothetical protein
MRKNKSQKRSRFRDKCKNVAKKSENRQKKISLRIAPPPTSDKLKIAARAQALAATGAPPPLRRTWGAPTPGEARARTTRTTSTLHRQTTVHVSTRYPLLSTATSVYNIYIYIFFYLYLPVDKASLSIFRTIDVRTTTRPSTSTSTGTYRCGL